MNILVQYIHLLSGCSPYCWKFNNLQTTKLLLFYSENLFSLNYRKILQPKNIFNFIRRLTKLMSFYHGTQPFITHQFERNFYNFHVLSINFQRNVAFMFYQATFLLWHSQRYLVEADASWSWSWNSSMRECCCERGKNIYICLCLVPDLRSCQEGNTSLFINRIPTD